MNMKHLIPVACLALSCLCMNPALAHGDVKPQYGGIVQKVNDVSFELVAQADGAIIYLMDHGKPVPSKGNKIEAEIKEAGENTLRVLGVKLGKGDKLVAALSNVSGKNMTVRFQIK